MLSYTLDFPSPSVPHAIGAQGLHAKFCLHNSPVSLDPAEDTGSIATGFQTASFRVGMFFIFFPQGLLSLWFSWCSFGVP